MKFLLRYAEYPLKYSCRHCSRTILYRPCLCSYQSITESIKKTIVMHTKPIFAKKYPFLEMVSSYQRINLCEKQATDFGILDGLVEMQLLYTLRKPNMLIHCKPIIIGLRFWCKLYLFAHISCLYDSRVLYKLVYLDRVATVKSKIGLLKCIFWPSTTHYSFETALFNIGHNARVEQLKWKWSNNV